MRVTYSVHGLTFSVLRFGVYDEYVWCIALYVCLEKLETRATVHTFTSIDYQKCMN